MLGCMHGFRCWYAEKPTEKERERGKNVSKIESRNAAWYANEIGANAHLFRHNFSPFQIILHLSRGRISIYSLMCAQWHNDDRTKRVRLLK